MSILPIKLDLIDSFFDKFLEKAYCTFDLFSIGNNAGLFYSSIFEVYLPILEI